MILKKFITGPFLTNSYLLGDEKSSKAAIIDPADSPDLMYKESLKEKLKIEYILLTHGHFDHTGGVLKLKKLTNAKITLNKKDLPLLGKAISDFSLDNTKIIGQRTIKPDLFLKEGDSLKIGKLKIIILETPGHSPGSLTYLVLNKAFVGDLIFKDGLGRTDLFGGSNKALFKSIKNKIFSLPYATELYPGHGQLTKVKDEIKKFDAHYIH